MGAFLCEQGQFHGNANITEIASSSLWDEIMQETWTEQILGSSVGLIRAV